MFTGIVEEIGKVKGITTTATGGKITLEAKKVLEETKLGDSIAVNGVCLTVTEIGANYFQADIMGETFRRSNLKKLSIGDFVNLERAMAANGRFGGHMVSGHIDGVGNILSMQQEGNAMWVEIKASDQIQSLVIEKGSIGIDGISLTVAKVTKDSFFVSVIPHTGQETTLLKKKPTEEVNLENDMVAKYIKHFLYKEQEETEKKEEMTMDFLQKYLG